MKKQVNITTSLENEKGTIIATKLFDDKEDYLIDEGINLRLDFKHKYNSGVVESWDSEEYIIKLMKTLKNKKKSRRTRGLKQMCKNFGFNYKEVKKDLVSIYLEGKGINFWSMKRTSEDSLLENIKTVTYNINTSLEEIIYAYEEIRKELDKDIIPVEVNDFFPHTHYKDGSFSYDVPMKKQIFDSSRQGVWTSYLNGLVQSRVS